MTSTMRFDKWQNSLGNGNVSVESGNLYSPGSVVQVQEVSYPTTFTTNTVESWISITNFAVSITPKFATSKMIINISIGRSAGSNATLWRVLRNGSTFSLPNVDGSRQRAHFQHSNQGTDTNHADGGISMTISDLPGTVSTLTYQLQFLNEGAGNHGTLFALNRNIANLDNGVSYQARTLSTMTVMEIAQ